MSDQPPTTTPFASGEPRGEHVPDHMVWAIIQTVVGFFICTVPAVFGVVGIVFAVQANSKKTAGDFRGAIEDAASAKKWLNIGLIVTGVLAAIAIVAFIGVLIVSAATASTAP